MINKKQQHLQEDDEEEEEYKDQVTKPKSKGKKNIKDKWVFKGFQCYNGKDDNEQEMRQVQAEH